MARRATVTVPAQTWTEITNANVTSLTFQIQGNDPVFVVGTTGPAPSNTQGALLYNPAEGELNAFLADLLPGVAAVRVWVYCQRATEIAVSHA